MALFHVERMGTENTEKNGWERKEWIGGTERMDRNGENCDFLCFYIDISFLSLNFIKIELSFMLPIIHTSIIGNMEFSIRT